MRKLFVSSFVFAALVLPASSFASTSVVVSGNGAHSKNVVNVSTSSSYRVSQSNTAYVVNHVSSVRSTGGNKANYNTGGSVYVQTGSSHSTVSVWNQLNSNVLGWWHNLCAWW